MVKGFMRFLGSKLKTLSVMCGNLVPLHLFLNLDYWMCETESNHSNITPPFTYQPIEYKFRTPLFFLFSNFKSLLTL